MLGNSFFHFTHGSEVFIELLLILAPKFSFQGFRIFEDRVNYTARWDIRLFFIRVCFHSFGSMFEEAVEGTLWIDLVGDRGVCIFPRDMAGVDRGASHAIV